MKRGLFVALLVLLSLAGCAVLAVLGVDLGWWHLNRPSLSRYPVRGIDVSWHRGKIDWALAATQPGLAFAYIKATEGGDWTDARFADNWRKARLAGLRVGAYHYFTFCRPPLEQAYHFLSVLPREPDTLPPAADLEFGGNCRAMPAAEIVRRDLRIFLDTVEAEVGRKPIIYTTPEAHETFIERAGFEHPLWIRGLYFEPSEEGWVFWQYDARGEVPGIEGPVDLNVFRGGREALDDL